MTRQSRLMILLPDDMLSEIDQYRRHAPDLPPRTEAIRRLVLRGLREHALDRHTLNDATLYSETVARKQAQVDALEARLATAQTASDSFRGKD